MEYWEFLLQQEGDQSWLPLDTAQVEILEGRYRIMAHTSQVNTPVQIQISQQLLDQVPPKRRTLRRRSQTNEDGLMVVIPFTRLGAGTWDIHCVGGGVADSELTEAVEPAWAYSIQLQVLARGSGDDDDWFADDSLVPAEESGDRPIAPGALGEASGSAVWPPLDLKQVAEAMDRVQAHLAVAADSSSLYRVALTQMALSGHEGEPVGLSGQITGVVEGESCSDMVLVVRLADPQTAQVVTLSPFSLAANTLPAHFSLAVTLPAELSTRLLLGEVGLVSLAMGMVDVLALQRFTVTVDLSSLFDAIANRAETSGDLSLDFAAASEDSQSQDAETAIEVAEAKAEAWAKVDLPPGPPRVMPILTLPRSGLSLPPKIYYPSAHEAKVHRPTLPPLRSPKPSRPAPESAQGLTEATPELPNLSSLDLSRPASPTPESEPPQSEPVEPSLATEGPSLDLEPCPTAVPSHQPAGESGLLPRRPSVSLPPLDTSSTPDRAVDQAPGLPQLASPRLAKTRKAKPAVPLLPSHEVMGFRDLKLQERFWSRLNDMAVTIQQEVMQKRAEESAAAVRSLSQEEGSTATVAPAVEPIPFAGEVVIYEDEDETLGRAANQPSPPSGHDSILEDHEIISPPVPLIEVPTGELIAGEPVQLTVRVPFHPNRLYIRVWMTDPQTRSLVDEPRQVMHLSPNGQGQLEGSIQLTVPLGCLEVQFEAISVDIITQQESYKATVTCAIAPAGLSTSDLEDFNL